MSKLLRALLFVGAVGAGFLTALSARADDPLPSDIVMLNIGGSGGTFTFSESSSSSFGSSGFGSEFAPAFAGPFALADGAVLLYDDPSQTVVSDQIWVQNGFFYFASDEGLQTLSVPVLGGLLETPGQQQDVSSFFGLDPGSVLVTSDVPEPSSVALAGLGLACLLSVARRRK